MRRCVLCHHAAAHGHLCDGHRKGIARSGVTPEQVAAPARPGLASLIDPWGAARAVVDPTVIGRVAEDGDVIVLHASVSARHARIERGPAAWRVHDLGSRNGTYVDNVRIESAPIHDGAVLRFGEVEFYFVGHELPPLERPSGPGRTAPSRRDRLIFAAALTLPSGARLELAQRVEGGVVQVGTVRLELSRLEFHLLQVLTEARREAATPDLAYLPWTALAERLAFNSHDADSENVRELVRRVRRKLEQAGLPELIDSRHGVGYRLTAAPLEDA